MLTERIMRKFCEFFGLEYNEILLKPTFNGNPIESNTSSKKDVSVGKVDKRPLHRYKEVLSSEEIRRIEKKYANLTGRMKKLAQLF